METTFKKWMLDRWQENIAADEPLFRHTTLKVGGPADLFVRVKDERQLQAVVQDCAGAGQPYLILGGGSNLLVKDGGFRGLVIDMKNGLTKTGKPVRRAVDWQINVQAGVRLARLCRYALAQGLAGMNFALGIPGTVGGAVRMNAGTAAGCMAEVVASLTVLKPDGQMQHLPQAQIDFGYRSCDLGRDEAAAAPVLIIAADLVLSPGDREALRAEARQHLQDRKEKQPWGVRCAGSFFKNPPGPQTAGQLIDQAGLRGKRVGDAEVSLRHANFLVNRGEASAADILRLMDLVQKTVADLFGVQLQPEVVIVGE